MKDLVLSGIFVLLTLGSGAAQTGPAGSPVARWGALHVENAQLTSAAGEAVVLRGLSLFDTTSYGQYANPAVLGWLRDDWKATLFRAAMYTDYNGQFVGERAYGPLFQAVQAAIDSGMYVLVDWHILTDGNPLARVDQARDFFARVADRFAGVPNVIYEICNEPNGKGVTWDEVIKPYALAVIPVVRARDPNAVIVVGTPEWSSHPETAAADPLPFPNLLYTLHFYAASHDHTYVDRLDAARAAGSAVFVTEWGTTTAQVTGRPAAVKSLAFADALADRRVSWANWSLGTKVEPASVLKPLASTEGGWAPGDLTESGLLVRAILRGEKTGPVFADNFDSGNFKAGGWLREGAALDRTQFISGSASVRFEEKTALSKDLLAEGVTGWTWAFQARGEGWTTGDRFVVEWSSDGQAWTKAAEVTPTAAWTPVTGTLPAEAEGTSLQFRLRSELGSAAGYWVDDVVVSGTRD